MANIKVREWKGLKTYIDVADIDNGYFNTFENLRPRIGYAEAKSLEAIPVNIEVPNGQTLILFDYIFLDEDKLKNRISSENKLVSDYTQNEVKYQLMITYGNNQNSTGYSVWIDGVYIGMHHIIDEGVQFPYIINNEGIVKILFKEDTLWLGKISRYRKVTDTTFELLYDGFYLDKLVESYDMDNLGITDNNGTIYCSEGRRLGVKLDTELISDENAAGESLRCDFEFIKEKTIQDPDGSPAILTTYRLLTTDGVIIKNPIVIPETYDWTFLRYTSPAPFGRENRLLFPKTYFYDNDNKPTYIKPYNTTIEELIEQQLVYEASFWGFTYYVFKYETFLSLEWDYISGTTVSNVGFTGQDYNPEILVTGLLDSTDEYIIAHEKKNFLAEESSKYIIKIKYTNAVDANKRLIALRFYFRSGGDSNDFEQCKTLSFETNKQSGELYINSLTPNGIFLTQTIGKSYKRETFSIVDVFDDYIDVNGTPFILKNGNILYPGVGTGRILENTFYSENYVPQVSGKFLTTLENKLAVFEENKEEMTYVDFQSVEGQLIFFVRGSATYRIKDYWDLIETPEGIIINLPDGIYATNGETRSLISLPINGIMKDNYSTSSIYYNSYEKEVLYICAKGIYVYRFETGSWSKMDFVGLDPTSANVIDIVDDYEGNMWVALTDNKVYKIKYKDAVGKFGLTNIDLQELAVTKRLNWIAVDAAGKVNGKETPKGNRGVLFFNNMLKDRKPSQWLDFQFTIEPIEKDIAVIYNLEMNFEAFPMRKV